MNIPADVTTLSSVAALLAQTLRSCSCDPEPLFAAAGIDMADASDPNVRISTIRMQTLWRLAIEKTGIPELGLVAVRQFQPAVLQGLGFAWLASDTLGDALGRLVRYSRIINVLPDFSLEESGDTVDLVIRVPDLGTDFMYAATDAGMGVFLRMCQITAAADIMPRRTSLQRPTPVDPAPYVAMFGPNIEFEADAYRLYFDKKLVHTRLSTANPELARLNDQAVIDYLARYDRSSITMQVRSKIIECLPDGRPNQGDIAETLHTSLRSLQRKLRNEETTFKDLLSETQQQLAMHYIQETHRSIGEITYLLGFSEPSNFTRAFKRWTGKSPAEYRESA
jgi:AraC-like DNA-binding protein